MIQGNSNLCIDYVINTYNFIIHASYRFFSFKVSGLQQYLHLLSQLEGTME